MKSFCIDTLVYGIAPYNYNIIFISDTDVYLKSDTPILHHNQVTIWNISSV